MADPPTYFDPEQDSQQRQKPMNRMSTYAEIAIELSDGRTSAQHTEGVAMKTQTGDDADELHVDHLHEQAEAHDEPPTDHETLASRVRKTIQGIAAPAEVLAETVMKGMSKVGHAADPLVQAVRSDLAGTDAPELTGMEICRNRS